MSWDSRPIATLSSCALLLVLAFVAAPSAAFSQSPVCHPIRIGETATQLARRITGDGRNKYQPWFQIMDSSSRFVPKSQYDRIRPGWRACIVKGTIETRSAGNRARRSVRLVSPMSRAGVRSRRRPSPFARSAVSAGACRIRRPPPFALSAVSTLPGCGLAARWSCRCVRGGFSTTTRLAGSACRS